MYGRRNGFAVMAAFLTLCCVGVFALVQSAAAKQRSTNLTRTDAGQASSESDPQVKAVLAKMEAAGALHLTTVNDVRKAYLFLPSLSGQPESVLRIENRQIPGPAGRIPVRIYVPRPEKDLPILVFFHGGAFVAGSLDSDDVPLRSISNRCGCMIVSVAYRLAPENPYPAAVNDAYAATKWVSEHASDLGGDARRVAVGGDGAGGNLAAVVTLMSRDGGGPKLIYQVLIYPSLDALLRASRYTSSDPVLTPDVRIAILAAYVPLTHDLQDPHVSPVDAKSLKNLPPALVVTDEDDPARDEGDAYARRLVADGVPVKVSPYPNMIHGFFLMAGELDVAKKAIEQISDDLNHAFQGTGSLNPQQRSP